MDKLIKRIDQCKNDPTLLHQTFFEFEEFLSTKLIENNKDASKTELSWLFNQSASVEQTLADEACQTVVRLTLRGVISVNESITALVSSATTAKHHGIIVNAIIALVLQGSYTGKRQPFITLLEITPDVWPLILHQTSNFLSNGYINRLIWNDIKPFFLYTLCMAPLQVRTILWGQLLSELYKKNSLDVLELLLESVVWQNEYTSNFEAAFSTINCIKQLSDYAVVRKDKDLAEVTAIMSASLLLELNTGNSFGLQPYFNMLEELTGKFDLCLEPVIMMLSQLILECLPSDYKTILTFCQQQTNRSCNKYVWNMLKFSALSVFSYGTDLERSIISICEASPETSRKNDLSSNKYFRHLRRFNTTVQETLNILKVALNDANCIRYAESTSYRKTQPNSATSCLNFLFHCGIFWETSIINSLDRAVDLVTSKKKFAQALLTLMLKKLTTPCSGKTKIEIFYRLPKLTIEKACVPRILQILDTVSICAQLAPLQITVLAELWKVEDRAYPYLEKLLFSDRLKSDEFLLAKASAVLTICSMRPEKYGSGILSVVSELLNTSLCTSNPNYTTVARLSLGALISLCQAEVVDLQSVWSLLSPKLLQENRAPVIIETCRLLALVPSLRDDSEDYVKFIHQAISVLFRMSMNATEPSIANAALRSLSEFLRNDFHLRDMPEICREDIKIPAKYVPVVKTETPVKAEDVLNYVPGHSWIKLMDCYSREVLQDGFSVLLSHLLKEEVESLPKWVYKKASADSVRKNEPANYNSTLKEDSILAASINYLQRICDTNIENRFRLQLVIKVLAGPFTKPLPPLDWSALRGFVQQHDLETEFLHIVFDQVPDSFSAQTITDSILAQEPLHRQQALAAIHHIENISKSLPTKSLQNFILRLFSDLQEDFDVILNGLQHSLDTGNSVPVELKSLIAEALMNVWTQLPDDSSCIEQFAICFSSICSPQQSFSDCFMKPALAINICLSAAFNNKGRIAIDYLYKAMQITANIECLSSVLIDKFIAAINNIDLPCEFVLQFTSYIQLIAIRPPAKDQHVSTLLEMLCLLLGILSGSLVPIGCLDNEESSGNFRNMLEQFSLYTARLFSQPKWKSARGTIQDWIMAMAENPNVTIEDRRRILDALPLLGGVDKEAFLKTIGVYRM